MNKVKVRNSRDTEDWLTTKNINKWIKTKKFYYRWPIPVTKSLSDSAEITKVEALAQPDTQPAPDGARLAVEAVRAVAGVVYHSTKPRRRDTLNPVIEFAQSKCRDPQDTAEVWAHLEVLAQAEHPPLQAAMEKGLKYSKLGEAAYLTMDALDKRLHPEKRKPSR